MKDSQENVETQYVTVTHLMKAYSMGRTTVIKWVKENPEVRYFQDERFLRVNLKDFEKLIEKKVSASREAQDDVKEQ